MVLPYWAFLQSSAVTTTSWSLEDNGSVPSEMPPTRASWFGEDLSGTVAELLSSGVLQSLTLLAALIGATTWANVASGNYERTLYLKVPFTLGFPNLFGELHGWVDNGLMTIFFLAAGLEIGRERAHGALRENRTASVPVAAAFGGMVGAALSFTLVATLTHGGAEVRGAWGVPMATDIAFALGGLQVLGKRVPVELRVFVLALAVADDVFSVVVLGITSAHHVTYWALGAAFGIVVVIGLARKGGVNSVGLLVLGVLGCWWCLATAGVEPVLAGAAIGMVAPMGRAGDPSSQRGSAGARLEHPASLVANYLVLPCFVLANAGVAISASVLGTHEARSLVTSLLVARTLGKMVGICGAVYLMVRFGRGALPERTTWLQLSGAALLCGVGFTVPLLYAAVAFKGDNGLFEAAQLGLLISSMAAFTVGVVVAAVAPHRGDHAAVQQPR